MGMGFRGTFVISWSQTEIDGLEAAPVQALSVGAAWAWRGEALRVDGPSDVLQLDGAEGAAELRRRAARMVHRLVGAALDGRSRALRGDGHAAGAMVPSDNSFVVTDGARTYGVTLIETGAGRAPLLMFVNEMPPRGRDLWIVRHSLGTAARQQNAQSGGVICFTPGTRIRTAQGTRPVETLRPGDLVQTRDNGLQPLRWTGSRRMSGARLFAIPALRPVRIRGGALGLERPDADLLVSPGHRMLIRGRAVQSLFNTGEVLVMARDLINGKSVRVDMQLREVTYIHLLLEQHQVLWANGVQTESFHPASADFTMLDPLDRQRLLHQCPEIETDPHSYGGYARRALSSPEAAILSHAA